MQKIKAHKQAFRRALRILYWVGLMILYLCAASRPGGWLRDAFLYRQTDGSFAGRDEYGIYALTVTAAEHETQAVFAMNGETIQYRIVTSSQENVQIYQDDRKIFAGQAIGEPGDAVLWAENGQLADDIHVVVTGEYQQHDVLPTGQWLYKVAGGGRMETRGNLWFLLPMGLLALVLFLDIKFPLLFWNLSYGLAVQGGEPSEWYCTMQKVSRDLMEVGIPFLALISFWQH